MIFMCCHPEIARDASVALSLKTAGGFSVREIARAFLADDAAIAQRLVRAKRLLREEGITFELPSPAEMSARLDSVLEVLYLLFNEGYTAHRGESLVRADLCEEAMRMLSLAVRHPTTDLPKSHALLALMLFQAARLPARVGESGDLFLLGEQDRALWDRRLIHQGFIHLDRSAEGDEFTTYHLQAAIAACHARARTADQTDWARIAALYDALAQLAPSPVVELNRAVALSMAFGPAAGLEIVDALMDEPSLKTYHLLPSVRGDLLAKLGRTQEARAEFERAASLARNSRERELLMERAEAMMN
jgi:predicted RNA polymerase sigma factor